MDGGGGVSVEQEVYCRLILYVILYISNGSSIKNFNLGEIYNYVLKYIYILEYFSVQALHFVVEHFYEKNRKKSKRKVNM